jgi:molybdate transport system substrate-binding protein
LAADFERASGHKLAITYDTAGPVKNRLAAGETTDVAFTQRSLIDELVRDGKLAPANVKDVVRSSVVVFVRTGAPKPDIGSVDALKRSLSTARSVAYSDPSKGGAAGVYFAGLIERLGLTEQMKPIARLVNAGAAGETVAKGDAELGVDQHSVAAGIKGIDIVGPLPKELQAEIVFAAAIPGTVKEAAAANSLIMFLTSAAAAPAFKAALLDPAAP